MSLQGKRLYLERLTPAHLSDKYVDWLNDPEVNQYLETRFVKQTPEMVLDFLKSKENSETEYLFGIFLKDSADHIGNIKVGPINTYHGYAPVSLFIGDKSTWGKGYATDAIELITNYSFEHLGLHKLEAGCYEENIGSKKAFEKVGYVVEGIIKGRRKGKDGRTSDILLGMTREEWKTR